MKIKTCKLTPELCMKLKKPIGILIEGSVKIGVKKLKELLAEENPPRLVAVGDMVTAGMVKLGVEADLYIVDHRIMRKPVKPVSVKVDQTLYASNPPSVITSEAWSTIEKALRSGKKTMVVIRGEEDLMVLPAVIMAPENSMIAYGQPKQGIVLVKATKKNKSICQKIVDAMPTISS